MKRFGRNPLKAGQVIPTFNKTKETKWQKESRNPLKAGQVIPTVQLP